MQGKDLLQSKQLWGTVVALLALMLQNSGIEFDQDQLVEQIMMAVGAVLYIIGTFSRKRAPITSVAGVKVRKEVKDESSA